VRERARQAGFANHGKKDSTGICFIGERRFRDFLQRYLPASPGEMVTPQGEWVADHIGLMYYTLGQRKGLGIGGRKGAGEGSWYVVEKDLRHNRLIVAQQHDHPLLLKDGLTAADLHWVAGEFNPPLPFVCQLRLRHRQPLQGCRVTSLSGDRMVIRFDCAQRAVTPGQSVVLYRDGDCLGGGAIISGENPEHSRRGDKQDEGV
jgi:tRNA-specific 2-thiouridylase